MLEKEIEEKLIVREPLIFVPKDTKPPWFRIMQVFCPILGAYIIYALLTFVIDQQFQCEVKDMEKKSFIYAISYTLTTLILTTLYLSSQTFWQIDRIYLYINIFCAIPILIVEIILLVQGDYSIIQNNCSLFLIIFENLKPLTFITIQAYTLYVLYKLYKDIKLDMTNKIVLSVIVYTSVFGLAIFFIFSSIVIEIKDNVEKSTQSIIIISFLIIALMLSYFAKKMKNEQQEESDNGTIPSLWSCLKKKLWNCLKKEYQSFFIFQIGIMLMIKFQNDELEVILRKQFPSDWYSYILTGFLIFIYIFVGVQISVQILCRKILTLDNFSQIANPLIAFPILMLLFIMEKIKQTDENNLIPVFPFTGQDQYFQEPRLMTKDVYQVYIFVMMLIYGLLSVLSRYFQMILSEGKLELILIPNCIIQLIYLTKKIILYVYVDDKDMIPMQSHQSTQQIIYFVILLLVAQIQGSYYQYIKPKYKTSQAKEVNYQLIESSKDSYKMTSEQFNARYEQKSQIYKVYNSSVYIYTDLLNGEEVIVKIMVQNNQEEHDNKMKEVYYMQDIQKLKNDIFIKVYSFVQEKQDQHMLQIYLIMQKADRSLHDLIRDRIHFTSQQIRDFLIQIVDQLLILKNENDYNLCHRDIKPQNILLLNNKYLLADFGISKVIKKEDDEVAQDDEIVGTVSYMSPELYYNHQIHKIQNLTKKKVNWWKNDVFSLGLTLLHAILLRDVSNYNVNEISIENVVGKNKLQTYDSDIVQCLTQMLTFEQSKRPHLEDIKRMLEPMKSGPIN